MKASPDRSNRFESFLSGLKMISDGAFVFSKWLLILLMFCIVTLVMIDILFRYVINISLIWPQEITKWCLVWVGYIGAGAALRLDSNVAMTMFTNRLSERSRFWVLLSGKFIILYFVVFFTGLGYQQAFSNHAFSWAVHIPYTYVMLGIPLAGLLMFIHLLYVITKDFYSLFYGPSSGSKPLNGIGNP